MSEFPALVLTLFTTLWDQLGVFTLFTTLWDQLGVFTLFLRFSCVFSFYFSPLPSSPSLTPISPHFTVVLEMARAHQQCGETQQLRGRLNVQSDLISGGELVCDSIDGTFHPQL